MKNKLKRDTQKFNAVLVVMGILELNMNLLKPMLGDHFGVVFIVVAVVAALLRERKQNTGLDQ
jgi:hypothetical protein